MANLTVSSAIDSFMQATSIVGSTLVGGVFTTYSPAQFATDSADPTKTAAGTFTEIDTTGAVIAGTYVGTGAYGLFQGNGGGNPIILRNADGPVQLDASAGSYILTGQFFQFNSIGSLASTTGASRIASVGSPGVMSVANDGATTALPIPLSVTRANYTGAENVAIGGVTPVTITATGAIPGDTVDIIYPDGTWSGSGGLLIKGYSVGTGSVIVNVVNADLTNSAYIIQNFSIVVNRPGL